MSYSKVIYSYLKCILFQVCIYISMNTLYNRKSKSSDQHCLICCNFILTQTVSYHISILYTLNWKPSLWLLNEKTPEMCSACSWSRYVCSSPISWRSGLGTWLMTGMASCAILFTKSLFPKLTHCPGTHKGISVIEKLLNVFAVLVYKLNNFILHLFSGLLQCITESHLHVWR